MSKLVTNTAKHLFFVMIRNSPADISCFADIDQHITTLIKKIDSSLIGKSRYTFSIQIASFTVKVVGWSLAVYHLDL
jgi:hypothetical protein